MRQLSMSECASVYDRVHFWHMPIVKALKGS